MPFEIKKFASHGVNNPIVARLSLQNLQILDKCKVTKEVKDKVGNLYLNSLMKKLLRCREIEDSFKKSFAEAEAKYEPPAAPNAAVEIPQIDRLEADCHNFLYEAKNYIRDVLTWSTGSMALHSPRRASSRRHGKAARAGSR